MRTKYPAEAFALGAVVFSTGMKEAFSAGILVLFTTVFAEILKNLLEELVPQWSLTGCVYIGTGAVAVSVFRLGLPLEMMEETTLWMVSCLIGFLAAKHILTVDLQAEYNELFWESAAVWGFWIVFAIGREFLGAGSVFGNMMGKTAFQSGAYLDVWAGVLTAGLILALANACLGKTCGSVTWLLLFSVLLYERPFSAEAFGQIFGAVWAMAVVFCLFYSVKKTLQFSRTGRTVSGLPTELLSLGFIYMILHVY